MQFSTSCNGRNTGVKIYDLKCAFDVRYMNGNSLLCRLVSILLKKLIMGDIVGQLKGNYSAWIKKELIIVLSMWTLCVAIGNYYVL